MPAAGLLAQGFRGGAWLILAGALAAAGGCSTPPGRITPLIGEKTLEPDPGQAPGESVHRGLLSVETALTGIVIGGISQRYRFYLYDAQGQYLDDYPNDRLSPVSLMAGTYGVLSQVGFHLKRVRVLIRPGLLTSVPLKALESGVDAD